MVDSKPPLRKIHDETEETKLLESTETEVVNEETEDESYPVDIELDNSDKPAKVIEI